MLSSLHDLLPAWAHCPARSRLLSHLIFPFSLLLGASLSFRVGSRNSRWFLSVLYLDLLSRGPAWALLSGSSLFSLSSYCLFLLRLPFLFPFLSSSPLLSFSLAFLFERCLPKVALPKVATPWDPTVVFSSHVDLPYSRWRCPRFSAAFPMRRLCCWCRLCCWSPALLAT